MVEPEIAENTVPATTATTARRPGTWRIRRSMPSITFSASPVWNRISPISTKSGIGVSEKLETATTLLRTICSMPTTPPRNSAAPMRLMARNEKATGMPMNSRTVEPPSNNKAPACQDMMRLVSSKKAQEAETASDRGSRSDSAKVRMRKMNSIATIRKHTGIGAKIHHSGSTRVLIDTEPAR